MRARHLKSANGALLTLDDIGIRIPEFTSLPTAGNENKNWMLARSGLLYYSDGSVLRPVPALPVDPNADRIVFWDDSAGNWAYLTPDSTLAISGTTLSVGTVPSTSVSGLGLVFIEKQTWSGVTSKSFSNNIFTATYRSYRVVWEIDSMASSNAEAYLRLRAGGSDDTTGTNYYTVIANLLHNGGSINGNTLSSVFYVTKSGGAGVTSAPAAGSFDLVAPQIADKTKLYGTQAIFFASGFPGGGYVAGVHTASTAYDSMTLLTSGGNFAGRAWVYGLRDT